MLRQTIRMFRLEGYKLNFVQGTCHVKWVPCHHGMARSQVADGGNGLQIRSVAPNMLNKQSRTANKG
jgi:hypothetical protein